MTDQVTGATGGSARVLLVDDEPDVRLVYTKALRRLGCEVVQATDGADAVDKLRESSFDLILSDISMPRLSGTAFLRAVRERDLDVPVVLMTGSPSLDTAVSAVEYGAFRYLIKPVDLDTLTQVVRRGVHMHQLARLKREALEVLGAEGDRKSVV